MEYDFELDLSWSKKHYYVLKYTELVYFSQLRNWSRNILSKKLCDIIF